MTAGGPERIRRDRMEILDGYRRASIAAVLALLAAALACAEGTPVDEYRLKAVFLFNFARFVEWQPEAFGDARDPFAICVAGANPFGSSLDDEVRGKTVASRPISSRSFPTPNRPESARFCLFPLRSASGSAASWKR